MMEIANEQSCDIIYLDSMMETANEQSCDIYHDSMMETANEAGTRIPLGYLSSLVLSVTTYSPGCWPHVSRPSGQFH